MSSRMQEKSVKDNGEASSCEEKGSLAKHLGEAALEEGCTLVRRRDEFEESWGVMIFHERLVPDL